MLKNECFIIKEMSFLKINDPLKRDAIVKEYLELKKKIRSNFLSERVGEQQLQTDLSKFYKPITETQKATTREITEGLKPVREGLETIRKEVHDIPGIVSDMEAVKRYGQEKQEEEEEEDEEEEEEEEEEEDEKEHGLYPKYYLDQPDNDEIFGIRKVKSRYYIGNKRITFKNDDIIIKETGRIFSGTPGLWGLITSKNPDKDLIDWTKNDRDEYDKLMLLTNALHKGYNQRRPPRSNRGPKWVNILNTIWFNKKPKKGYEGSGVVVIPSDPNALLERLDLLLASQEAGHTGVRNELVSICDELKRQGVLDTNSYKKLNHLIKK